jgi:hypothetical protein
MEEEVDVVPSLGSPRTRAYWVTSCRPKPQWACLSKGQLVYRKDNLITNTDICPISSWLRLGNRSWQSSFCCLCTPLHTTSSWSYSSTIAFWVEWQGANRFLACISALKAWERNFGTGSPNFRHWRSYSFWKGVVSELVNCPGGPQIVSIWLRAGWRLGACRIDVYSRTLEMINLSVEQHQIHHHECYSQLQLGLRSWVASVCGTLEYVGGTVLRWEIADSNWTVCEMLERCYGFVYADGIERRFSSGGM